VCNKKLLLAIDDVQEQHGGGFMGIGMVVGNVGYRI
jgi:hypothetical protein